MYGIIVHYEVCNIEMDILGLQIFTSEPLTDETEARALGHAQDQIDIYSCSYGALDDGKTVNGPGMLVKEAIAKGATTVKHLSLFTILSFSGAISQTHTPPPASSTLTILSFLAETQLHPTTLAVPSL